MPGLYVFLGTALGSRPGELPGKARPGPAAVTLGRANIPRGRGGPLEELARPTQGSSGPLLGAEEPRIQNPWAGAGALALALGEELAVSRE